MKVITALFLRGAAAIFPLALTLYVAYWLIVTVERSVAALVPEAWYFPGLGWIVALGVILGAGVLMQVFLIEWLHVRATSLLNRVPLLRSIYGTFQDLFSFIGSRSTDEMSTVVRVVLAPGMSVVGFVTNKAAHRELRGIDEGELIAVYLPMSYQIGGYTVFVPPDRVTPLDLAAEDAMKLVLTAGLKKSGD
jgi:uncharacterized membrane protein